MEKPMTTPTSKQMNEAQVAEYIKWLETEIHTLKGVQLQKDVLHSDILNAALAGQKTFEEAKAKFLSLLSSSSTTPSTEEVLRGMKAISDGFFNKKDYESAGRINVAMDVIERELKNETV